MNRQATEDAEKIYNRDELKTILQSVMNGYAGEGFNGFSYLTTSDDQQIFAVVSIATIHGKRFANAGLIVRIQDNRIIIEHDLNDKILADALMQAGVPREQIVLAYAGETVEEAV